MQKCAAVTVILAVAIAKFGGDGWESHPLRTSSAPQTVLKTADHACATVCPGAYTFDWSSGDSARVRVRPRKSMKLAVNFAVNGETSGTPLIPSP